jgi:hypothetical protein
MGLTKLYKKMIADLGTLLALGETQTTAYRGDRGKEAYDHSQAAHAPSDANNYVHPNHSGDVTSVGDGATSIAATAISSKSSATLAGSEEVLVNDAGTLKKSTTQAIANLGGGGGEWSADTVSQIEAEAGTATTRRAWTAERVKQAIAALENSTYRYTWSASKGGSLDWSSIESYKINRLSNAASPIEIPSSDTRATGDVVLIMQTNADYPITFTAGSGVSLWGNFTTQHNKLLTLIKYAENQWLGYIAGSDIATSSDVDTGTDNTKYVTAKSLKDAKNVPSVVPGTSGNVLTSNGTDWTSAAPAGGGGDMVLASEQSVTGLKTFDKDKLAMKGTSTGKTTVSTANASATDYTATLPAKSITIAGTDDIPTKASGSDINTGTDDNKYVTSKAIADSNIGKKLVGINPQTGTTYTLVLADAGKLVRCSNANAITLTIPKNSSVEFATGTVIYVEQQGAGVITVAPVDGDVTINSTAKKTWGQYSVIELMKLDTNLWNVIGGSV